MIDDHLLFHLLAAAIFLVIGIRACVIFLKWRTKYNLTTLIIIIIFFVGTILSFFHPGKLNYILAILLTNVSDSPAVGIVVRILLALVFIVLLYAFLFYPDIKRFLIRRKTKNK